MLFPANAIEPSYSASPAKLGEVDDALKPFLKRGARGLE
jgi:hypothetical protein